MAESPTGSAGTDGAPNPIPPPVPAASSAEPRTPVPTSETGAGTAGAQQGSPAPAPEVAALRAELAEAHSKAEGAQQGIVDRIAKALGIGGAGEAPTVEQVTEQLTAAQREARERAVDLAVYRAAPAAGADPDGLLDSTAFRRRVADLDPAADGFANKVTAAITDAVTANPRLAAPPAAAPRSGGQITGGSATGGDDLGALSVEDYIKRTRKKGNS